MHSFLNTIWNAFLEMVVLQPHYTLNINGCFVNDNLMTDIFYGNQDNSLLTILDSIEDTENEIKVNYKSPYMDTANLKTFLEKN